MAVRAKFRLNSYTTEMHTQYPHTKPVEVGPGTVRHDPDYSRPEQVEKRTLNFTPVGDSSPENKSFWEWTPSGSLQLGCVNQEAWKRFEIGKEYYLDFTPAE
jgi:hypothetical protein